MIPYEDGWMILDYKSDQIDPEKKSVEETMKDRYRTQIEMYRCALEKFGKSRFVRVVCTCLKGRYLWRSIKWKVHVNCVFVRLSKRRNTT